MIDDGGIDFRFEQLTWNPQERTRAIISWIGSVILFENRGHPGKFPALSTNNEKDVLKQSAAKTEFFFFTFWI